MRNIPKTVLILFASLTLLASVFLKVEAAGLSELSQIDRGYLIGPEDVMEISVWKNADLSRIVIVRPDGRISLPLIGDVQAGGRTPDELRQAIVDKLKEYQETVVVSVIVQEVNTYRIFMLGEVKSPGTYMLKRNTSILQAIALAGGFTDYASKNRIVVIRGGENIKIRFDDIVNIKKKEGENNDNLILKPGDTIFVPGGTIFLP
ncbi:MAG: polysaccharide biosynthesis/export family protein [Thermodesulfobacteriota bacterium]